MENSKVYFMEQALKQAYKAFLKNEVPIGAVIVKNNKIIGVGYNKRNKSKLATRHAEIIAIEKACKKNKDWRLENCEMYVTAIPCPMCAGAIVNSRIKTVYFGATNENSEIFCNIMSNSYLNHKTNFEGGLLEKECSDILKKFFKNKRIKC